MYYYIPQAGLCTIMAIINVYCTMYMARLYGKEKKKAKYEKRVCVGVWQEVQQREKKGGGERGRAKFQQKTNQKQNQLITA